MHSRHLTAEDRAAARAEAGGLAHEIVRDMLELEQTVSGLSLDIVESSRVNDTFRAMQQVMQGLRGALVTRDSAQQSIFVCRRLIAAGSVRRRPRRTPPLPDRPSCPAP